MRLRRLALIGFSAFCGLASAGPITYDLANLPGGTPASQSSRIFTVGSLLLTVTGLGMDEDALPNPVETEAVSFAAGKGLGVRDVTDLLVSDIDAVDGNRGNEELVFTFNQNVLFKSMTFADASNQAFANEIFFILNDSAFGDFNGAGVNIAWQAWPVFARLPAGVRQGDRNLEDFANFPQDRSHAVPLPASTVDA